MAQTTIKHSISLQGVGVHSGEVARVTFHQAPPGTGIVLYRDTCAIPADWTQISDTRLCTVLGHEAPVATVEHMLAAVSAQGLDNLIIEVQGVEIPILDGSAHEFYFALESVGREVSHECAAVRSLHAPVRVTRGDAYCELLPSETLSFEFSFAHFPSECLKAYPSASFSFDRGSFEHEVARARTFGMISDYPKLKASGCALGANEFNVLALDESGVLNVDGFRMADEPARHKILDAVGDLLLLGGRLRAHFRGHGSGHALHHALMQAASKQLCVALP